MMVRLLSLALALVPATTAAQTVDKPIVVTGRQPPPETRKQAVRKLAAAISTMTGEQLARFSTAICPAVDGFEPPYNAIVRQRIAADARAAKLEVDREGCRPNVTLVVVDDGRAMLETLYRQTPALFRNIPTEDRRALLAAPGPVHVLTVTQIRSRDGNALRSAPLAGGPSAGSGIPYLLVESASAFDPQTRQDINGALVLIDRAAAMGKSLGQIADYAAMRALARLNGHEVSTSEPTILTLFTDPATPRALTAFDSGYLGALYKGGGDRFGRSKIGDIVRTVTGPPKDASPAGK